MHVSAGTREDGSIKVRPIDDFTRSQCNAATGPTERLQYESLDLLLETIRQAKEAWATTDLALWKADVDSAYRRIPVAPSHRQYAWTVFKAEGETMVAQHLCLPFGAVASVHHWNRAGDLFKTIARKLLHVPVLRHG